MNEHTKYEQNIWEHYKKIEHENFCLKKQLAKNNKELRGRNAAYSSLLKKYKKLNESRKPRYTNNSMR